MINRPLIVTLVVFLLALAVGGTVFLFWRLGIVKKEAQLSQAVLDIQQKTEFIRNYPFGDITKYLQNLSTKFIPLPTISPEELGRPSLF